MGRFTKFFLNRLLHSPESSDPNNSLGMLASDLETNVAYLKKCFEHCDDITFLPITIDQRKGCIVYLQEITDASLLASIQDILAKVDPNTASSLFTDDSVRTTISRLFPISKINEITQSAEAVSYLLEGDTLLLIDGVSIGFIWNTPSFKDRSITEPMSEQVVRGPRDGFVENIRTNVTLIRKRIKAPDLKVEYVEIGTRTHTKIAVIYLKGIANDGIVKEVHTRLSRIQLDGILESQYIEQCIEDAPFSPFPTVYNSERPDRVSAAILEGKVAILTDGTPFALTMPAVFIEFLYANEDYYEGSFIITLIRWIRTIAFFIALTLPSLYLAVTTIHQDMLQTPLLLRIAAFQEDLPYPAFIEIMAMQAVFEIVREAGIRMPKAIGSAVTIVGTLVIGQAAVQAGLIGPLVIIVIAVTALSNFILPNYAFMQVIRILSFAFILLAALFGLMGIIAGLIALLAHLSSLRSFGVPFLSPLSPARKEAWKDVVIRAPWWAMNQRVPGQHVQDPVRGKDGRRPKPPKKEP